MTIKSSIRNRTRDTKLYEYYSVLVIGFRDLPLIIAALLYRFYPIKRNKVVLSSFNGMSYSGQPYEICRRFNDIVEKDIVWILPESLDQVCPYRRVNPNSIRSIYELMTAGVWIDNCRKKYWIKKRKGQLYIQTWHGPVCLKAVEKDAEKSLPPFYVRGAKRDSMNADYIVSETKWRTNNIINSFWYSGKLIKGEFKKNTNLEDSVRKVSEYFSINKNTRILLYVPTFREDNSINNYINDFESILSVLEETTGCEWVAIIRLHPNVANRSNYITYDSTKLNGSLYQSIDDLIAVSDFIITDYSGCIFDGYRAGKKVIIYAKDYEEYVTKDREMYFDLKELPSPITFDIPSLVKSIVSFDNTEYELKLDTFVNVIGYYDADAADLCVEIIDTYIKGGNLPK